MITRWAAPEPARRKRRRAFVDFQNDVTSKDLLLATQEGFHSIEHVKRYTTTGMATDQGKTSNMNALSIVAAELGRPVPAVGLTTFRPPYTPVTFGTLAAYSRGVLFDPVRTTPAHGWAAARGAVFEDVGLWKRARYFPRGSEGMHAAVARECRTVRAAVLPAMAPSSRASSRPCTPWHAPADRSAAADSPGRKVSVAAS